MASVVPFEKIYLGNSGDAVVTGFKVFTESKSLNFGEKDAFGVVSCFGELKEREDSEVEARRDMHIKRNYVKQRASIWSSFFGKYK